MERSVGFSPIFLLLLLLWEPAALLCSLSLGYKFTVTPNGQPWCEIQGQVNGNTLLHYACSSQKVKLISVLEINATQAWNQQRDALKYVMEELKKILLDIKAKRIATSDPLSLQGSMLCKQESNGRTSASWEFALDGQISLCFDSKNGNWTVLHGEGRLLNKPLASDRALTDLLVRTSTGDCRKWLKQVLYPQDEVLSTKAASTTATAPATALSEATASKRITSPLPVILTCWVIAGIAGAFTVTGCRCCQEGPESVDYLSDSAFAWLPLGDLLLIFRAPGVQTF